MKAPYPKYETMVIKGRPWLCRATYAVALILRDRHGRQYLHHVEMFFGNNGTKVRAEAMRYATSARAGNRRIYWPRDTYLSSDYSRAGVPPTAEKLEVLS